MNGSSLQNIAPDMQRALLLTLGLGVVAVVIYMFCVQPAQAALARIHQNLEGAQSRQDAMLRDLRGAQQIQERLGKLTAERKVYLDGMLSPLLASYAMRAKSLLDPIAEQAGATVVEYAELAPRRLPLTKPQAEQLYARQPIRLTCQGSYAALVSFLMRVEKLMPLVAMEALELKTQQNNDVQSAVIVLEWPILGVNTAAAANNGGARK